MRPATITATMTIRRIMVSSSVASQDALQAFGQHLFQHGLGLELIGWSNWICSPLGLSELGLHVLGGAVVASKLGQPALGLLQAVDIEGLLFTIDGELGLQRSARFSHQEDLLLREPGLPGGAIAATDE